MSFSSRRKPSQARLGLKAETPSEGARTLEGEVIRVTFESEDSGFRVLRVAPEGTDELETVVGVLPAAPPGTRVRATGQFVDDARHGRQFKADTLLTLAPSTLDGLRRYLASGMVPGIGPTYATRIVDHFGEQTLEVLDREPERLQEIAGIGARRARSVATAWAEHRDIGAIMVFLQSHGVSPALATRIYRTFGNDAIHVVTRSPYRLSLDVWGIGFKTADAIARSIGVDANSLDRAQAGLLQTLHDVTAQGDVFIERPRLIDQAVELLQADEATVRAGLEQLEREGRLRVERLGDSRLAVYLPTMHAAEVRVAERLRRLSSKISRIERADGAMAEFERLSGLELASEQRQAIRLAAESKVLVITGGPGVGKTTIVRAILALFDMARIAVSLAAPTGRAAKRMSEATGREAKTLHRLLAFEPKTGHFKHDRSHPLEAGAVVVDEASMVGVDLADALLQAVADESRLVLVGDVDQLPPVAPGAVLRDIIHSGKIPTVRLTHIFRQAEGSSIVVNAHRIHAGAMPQGAAGRGEQFYIIERRDPPEAKELVRELCTTRIPQGFGLDPVRDVQVLTPMQRGPTGAIALNEMLQHALNPTGPCVQKGSRVLRLGDKVMQLRNDYDKEVFNGDIGWITAIDEADRQLTVCFDGRQIPFRDTELDELGLAYATSIHKSQGNEYPAVVITLLTSHFVMLSRNLLYTAVTRGKQLVVLVADPRAIGIALSEIRRKERATYLAERIGGA